MDTRRYSPKLEGKLEKMQPLSFSGKGANIFPSEQSKKSEDKD